MKIPEVVEFNVSSVVGGIVAVEVVLFVDEMFGMFKPPIAWERAHPADNVIM